MIEVKQKPLSETGLAITFGLLALGLLFKKDVLIVMAFVVSVIFIFVPPLARLIDKGWMAIAQFLGNFNGRILLGIVYYIFLTPISFLFRIFNKDTLWLNYKEYNTMFKTVDHKYKPEDFEDMW